VGQGTGKKEKGKSKKEKGEGRRALALFGGLKPTLHYCGALGGRHRLELSMVAPEFGTGKCAASRFVGGILLDGRACDLV